MNMPAATTFKTTTEAHARRVAYRTRGHSHGPITRLVSPSDVGELIKRQHSNRQASGQADLYGLPIGNTEGRQSTVLALNLFRVMNDVSDTYVFNEFRLTRHGISLQRERFSRNALQPAQSSPSRYAQIQ
jgi:hypothetical protein